MNIKTKINPNNLFTDPAPDILVPPSNDTLIMESHGSRLFVRLHLPAFEDMDGKCPVVVMLHGYPGNERNFDIAQSLRMAGAAVVHFSYRGVWGSHGEYCFSHIIEDAIEVASQIRARAEEFRIDPQRLYLFGHSMGGFAALNAMAQGLEVAGAILMAPCNMSHKYLYDKPSFQALMDSQKNGYFNTPSGTYIEEDVSRNAEKWLFANAADHLNLQIPYAFIGGSLDQLTPPEVHILPLMELLREKGASVQYRQLRDGHDFPASRVELTRQIVQWLAEMDQ